MTDFDRDAFAGGGQQSFDQMYPLLAALRPFQPQRIAECEQVLERAREFRQAQIEPNALEVERKVMRDPSYVAEDLICAAGQGGWFSMMVPKMFGGEGMAFGASLIGSEEIAAGCLGIGNLLAVHGLAVSTVAATGDIRGMERVCRLLADSEKRGKPLLLSTAITEPGAGTDVEDVDFLRTAKICCEARPVKGGYELNGRKVFISNGSIAPLHVVIMPTDRKNPVRSTFAFLVETATPGFKVGRVERKMGQKACPAAELVFDKCFVPESARLSSRPLPGRRIELVLGLTRGGVGVFGTGVARGAFERTLAYAKTHKLAGRWLIDRQWVQMRLSDMLRNVMIARASYVSAMLSNELFGLASLVSGGRSAQLMRRIPQAVFESKTMRRLIVSDRTRKQLQAAIAGLPEHDVDTASAFGAAAKVTATDLGIENCQIALDIVGADGLRHDLGIEKLFRDAKLLQIYEGTNQLNRLELYKRAVNRAPVSSEAFDQSAPEVSHAPEHRPHADS
jgi:acyl-CoA dehydrogenase